MSSDLTKLAADPKGRIGVEVAHHASHQLKKILEIAASEAWPGPQPVHDMRVATRRLRELMKIEIDSRPSKRLKNLHRFARSLGKLLGAVRSDDVLLDALTRLESGNPVRALTLAVTMRRRSGAGVVQTLLKSPEFEEWAKAATKDFHHPRHKGPTVEDEADRLVAKSLAKVLKHRQVQPDDEFTKLHALRIDAKHLRYRVEFFGQVRGQDAIAAIEDLTKLQDHLGELHDDIVLLGELDQALSLALGWNEEEIAGLERLRESVKDRVDAKRKEAPATWAFLFQTPPEAESPS